MIKPKYHLYLTHGERRTVIICQIPFVYKWDTRKDWFNQVEIITYIC